MSRVGHIVQIAIQRLMRNYPFHAGLVSRWNVIESDLVSTMGIRFTDSFQLELIYNPDFVSEITLDEVAAVLLHESNHVILGHLFLNSADYEYPDLLVIAMEVTANEFIQEALPCAPILLSDFPFLEENQSTQERYKLLVKNMKKIRGGSSGGRGSQDVGTDDSNGAGKAAGGTTLDDHSGWELHEGNASIHKQVVAGDLGTTLSALSPDNQSKIDPRLKKIIEEATSRTPGTMPGDAIRETVASHRQIKSWAMLNQYIGQTLSRSFLFNQPPRRMPHLVGIVPGNRLRPKRPKILAVIDSSSSITAMELGFISAELSYIGKNYEIVVAECDADIQRVYPFRGPIVEVAGGGGTDFRPVFEHDFLRQIKPDLILYFTDGFGPAPEKRPSVPVVWVLYTDEIPAKWGKVMFANANFGTEPQRFGTKVPSSCTENRTAG